MKRFLLIALFLGVLCTAKTTYAADNVFVYRAGDVTIYRIADRMGGMPESLLLGGDRQAIAQLLTEKTICPNMFVSFLLVRGNEKILIDSGYGEKNQGQTVAILKNLGIDPKEITEVLLTHMHRDHILGLFSSVNGKTVPTYPKATISIDEAEYRFWTDRKNATKAPANQASCFESAELLTKLYANKIHLLKKDAMPVPWLRAISLPGHTEGHSGFALVAKDGKNYLFGGDFLHCLAVQSRYPDVTVPWDTDQDLAKMTRKSLLKKIAGTGTIVLGGHFPNPGAATFHTHPDGGYSYTFVQPAATH